MCWARPPRPGRAARCSCACGLLANAEGARKTRRADPQENRAMGLAHAPRRCYSLCAPRNRMAPLDPRPPPSHATLCAVLGGGLIAWVFILVWCLVGVGLQWAGL